MHVAVSGSRYSDTARWEFRRRLEAPRATPKTRTFPDTLRVSVFGSQPDPGRIEHYLELGCERITLWLPPAGSDVVLPMLDKYADLLG